MTRLALLVFVTLVGCSKAETRTVPADSCRSTATGNTYQWQQMVCYSYDPKSGACSMWMPQYYEDKEVVTTCTFKEWQ